MNVLFNKTALYIKKGFLFFVLFFLIISAKANVSDYTFSSSNGTYNQINGTILFSGTWDDDVSQLIFLPFAFVYNGANYNSVSVNTNGFIRLGALSGATNYCGLQSSPGNCIAGYGTDLVYSTSNSTIQYQILGAAPNRQFIVQWDGCKHQGTASSNQFSFQIILNETSNKINIVFGGFIVTNTLSSSSCLGSSNEAGDVGLIGINSSDINIAIVNFSTYSWSNPGVTTTLSSAVCAINNSIYPGSGLTYTWTPGVNMVYVSSTTSFINNGDSPGSNNAIILKLQINSTGTLNPLVLNSIALSTSGCTSPNLDILDAKIYFSGNNNIFSTSSQFGATFSNPNGEYNISGAATLSNGANYFWMVYELKPTAIPGDFITGCCTQISGTGNIGISTPTITCPSGNHPIIQPLGSWIPVTTAPDPAGGLILLLSNGNVISLSGSSGGNNWNKLTPDIFGSYSNGTWASIAPMNDARLYFSSQVLKDGRVYVAGGEYYSNSGISSSEIYDPVLNIWSRLPAVGATMSDANSEILENGKVLQALVSSGSGLRGTAIYDPITNTYSPGPNCIGIHNESVWVKLPDNSILFVDRNSTNSERYIPATNTWIADATVPVALYDPYGLETGAGVLLPDGRAFFIGSLGHTAFYTPSGSTANGIWTAGPDLPNNQGQPDGPMAMLSNGRVLIVTSPIPTSTNHFPTGLSFYEYDVATNSFYSVSSPNSSYTQYLSAYVTNLLDLPDGNILFAVNGSNKYYIYKPGFAQLSQGMPTINTITQITCDTFKITGTLFNGISEGASYGDDAQMATNFPVVRLRNGSNVYYCKSFNWNSTGVMRGNKLDTVLIALPGTLPLGSYNLEVTANGISSTGTPFVKNANCNTVLPIIVLQLSGQILNNNVMLQWQASTDLNSKEIVVEKSFDAIKFNSIAKLNINFSNIGLANNYSFADNSNLQKSQYYRLKLVGKDGQYFYSNVINVKSDFSNSTWLVNATNPFTNTIHLQFAVKPISTLFIKLFDVTGKLLFKENEIYVNGLSLVINIPKNLRSGTYFLEMMIDGKIITKKMIKL